MCSREVGINEASHYGGALVGACLGAVRSGLSIQGLPLQRPADVALVKHRHQSNLYLLCHLLLIFCRVLVFALGFLDLVEGRTLINYFGLSLSFYHAGGLWGF